MSANQSVPATASRPLNVPIDAVIFDVDGTLYSSRRLLVAFAPLIAGRFLSHPRSTLRAVRAIRAYRHAHERLRGARNHDLGRAQLELAAARTGLSVEEMRRLVTKWFEAAPLDAMRRIAPVSLRATLMRLREGRILIGVLSDYPPLEKLKALQIADLVDVAAWAQQADVGALKPDPAGLAKVVRLLETDVRRTLYVGDRPDIDERAARTVGCFAAIIGRRTPHHASTLRVRELGDVADCVLSSRV